MIHPQKASMIHSGKYEIKKELCWLAFKLIMIHLASLNDQVWIIGNDSFQKITDLQMIDDVSLISKVSLWNFSLILNTSKKDIRG